jgi:hypothetical protein
VYGNDDRREYFQVSDQEVRNRLNGSLVALVHRSRVTTTQGHVVITAPSLGESAGLCPGEPFADQPAAAFCSAVLVDRDLLLSSGHCTRVHALADFVAVFGYYYAAPGQLAAEPGDVHELDHIVSESLGGTDEHPRVDHAWLRLQRRVTGRPPPAPVRISTAAVTPGTRLTFMGAGGGVPMKIDQGASVFATGAPWWDYFVADTDTVRGASGGGAFDEGLALLGVLDKGGPDFVETDRGCQITARPASDGPPREELTYAAAALAALCAAHPEVTSLCRADCGDPCAALPPPREEPAGGCRYVPGGDSPASRMIASVLLCLAALRAISRRRVSRET